MKREIQNAYAALTPTEEQRQDMLEGLLSRASALPPQGRKSMSKKRKTRLLTAACIAALLLALGVTAYAEGWFGLGDLAEAEIDMPEGFSQEEIQARNRELAEAVARGEDPEKKLEEMDARDYPRPTVTRRVSSLAGLEGSPEGMAFQEYLEFQSSYDPDCSILRSIGNRPTGLEEEYGAYGCYTREMADKVDEICEKYGLIKLGQNRVLTNARQLYAYAGTGAFAPKDDHFSGQKLYPVTAYADGSFHADGELREKYLLSYQIVRCRKGSFNVCASLELGDAEEWTEWSYTTQNGVELVLAQKGNRALILADRPESFVTLTFRGTGKPFTDCRALEEVAELFDFSAIP